MFICLTTTEGRCYVIRASEFVRGRRTSECKLKIPGGKKNPSEGVDEIEQLEAGFSFRLPKLEFLLNSLLANYQNLTSLQVKWE